MVYALWSCEGLGSLQIDIAFPPNKSVCVRYCLVQIKATITNHDVGPDYTLRSWCLRSILGVSWRDHVPNSTILHLTGSYDLTAIIRQRCLRWLGHVHCMEDGRLPQDILFSEFYNVPRRTGRPKLRYKDVIKRDITGFHISPQS